MPFSKIFLFLCLSFLSGIAVNSFFVISQPLMLGILILGIFFTSFFWERKRIIILGLCLIFAVMGVWRHQSALSEIVFLEERDIVFEAVVSSEADIREDHAKIEVESPEIEGRILLTTDVYPKYNYGDKLKISGTLKPPISFDDFDYGGYLAKDGIYSVMYYPKIEFLGENKDNPASYIYKIILSFKEKLRQSINRNLPPPQSSILSAMILGDKGGMSDQLKERLNSVGLRHITAISGMHITIISLILMQILLAVGFWRGQAFYLTILFLIFFVLMVGLPASAVRAAIMASCFLLAEKLGREASSFRLLTFAAVSMLALNPFLLKFDTGFQLSFLAVAGIIFLSPYFNRLLNRAFEGKFINLKNILSMTLAAQVFTLPIMLYSFGQISLIAPISNILVLPILPFILGLGIAFSLAGILWQPLGWFLSWLVWLLLSYLVKIVDWFSQVPLAFLEIRNLHWGWIIVTYLIFFYFCLKRKGFQESSFL
jgi:competence protein ComEC